MTLNLGLNWKDLYDSQKLMLLHQHFLDFLSKKDPELYWEFYTKKQPLADQIIPLALWIEHFIVEFFGIESQVQDNYNLHHTYRFTSHFKRNFIQRDALYTLKDAIGLDGDTILLQLSVRLGQRIDPCDEALFAQLGLTALSRKDDTTVDLFRQYAAWAYYSEEGKARHLGGFLFKKPKAILPLQRFPLQKNDQNTITACETKPRSTFDLSDKGLDVAKAVDEAFYCIKCHDRGKDTCRSGLKQMLETIEMMSLGNLCLGVLWIRKFQK
jgi:hypothetical protein